MTRQRSAPPPERTRTESDRARPAPGAGTLAMLALAWLAAVLGSARHTLGVAPRIDLLVLTQAVLALPAVIAATLLAGAATGLAALDLAARRAPAAVARWVRLAVTATAGALVGGVAAAAPALGYPDLPSLAAIGGAIAGAGLLGGVLAGVLPRTVTAAAATGTLAVFLVGLAVGLFDGDLLDLFGAGESAESVTTANAWVRLTTSLVAGVAAGVAGYAYLRRHSGLRWPAYLMAGSAPGALVLLAEVLTRIGGARLFHLVSQASPHDATVLGLLQTARVNRALTVLFAGGLVALVWFGRTLKPPPAQDAETAQAEGTIQAEGTARADDAEANGAQDN